MPNQEEARPARGTSSRSKRADIINVATDSFGRQGYENTKWADVATAVGVGSTALYHYFESKQHCLYVIMADALEFYRQHMDEATAQEPVFRDALLQILHMGFDLSEREVYRNRILVAEQGRIGVVRTSPREEEARAFARYRTRDLEVAWATFLARGMEQGALPESDPRLLSRALLGAYSSVWHWYRPRGVLTLDELRAFFVPRLLALIGFEPRPT